MSTAVAGLSFDQLVVTTKGTGCRIEKERFFELLLEHTQKLGESPIAVVGDIAKTQDRVTLLEKAKELKLAIDDAKEILGDDMKEEMVRLKSLIKAAFRAEGKNVKFVFRLNTDFASALLIANGKLDPKSEPNNVLALIIKYSMGDKLVEKANELGIEAKGVTVTVYSELKATRGASTSASIAIQNITGEI